MSRNSSTRVVFAGPISSPNATKRHHARRNALRKKGFVQRSAAGLERRIKFMVGDQRFVHVVGQLNLARRILGA
ncbi:MAG: hypothetical protein DI604_33600 [Delftia acidovorans]|nr:MAG: hypothetical protein DI604_33600 [Delftia acidovorans]